MKRSSWRTLRPHQKHANTFGSAEWKTRLSISESKYFCHDRIGFFLSSKSTLESCGEVYSGSVLTNLIWVIHQWDNEGRETPLTFSEWHKPASVSAFYVKYSLMWARVMRVPLSAREGRLKSKHGAAQLKRSATGDVTSHALKRGHLRGRKVEDGVKAWECGLTWPYVMVCRGRLYFITASNKTIQ